MGTEKDIEKLALEWFVGANKKEIIFDLGWIKIFEAGYRQARCETGFSLEDMKGFTKWLIKWYRPIKGVGNIEVHLMIKQNQN